MERFEIQDIISQNDIGVVFRAIDGKTGDTVAIHRFLPFGQNNGALSPDECIAFTTAATRLSEVEHPALRSVIFGGTDPIDHIPYLATQWIEGVPLRIILATETLEPALVIDILRLALEVSTVLSHVLGEEAVWIETTLESIIVGTENSGRGFTFLISPFKWIGTDSSRKDLSSIIELGEELTGWKGKLITDQAGLGLGAWLKRMRKNPSISLHEALASLAESTGNKPPQAQEIIVQTAVRPIVKRKKRFSKAALLTTAVVALGICSAALIYHSKTTQPSLANIPLAEQKPVEIIKITAPPAPREAPAASPAPAPAAIPTSTSTSAPVLSETDKVNALALKLSKQTADKNSPNKAQISKLESARKKRGGIYHPDDTLLLKRVKNGTPVKLQGTLKRAAFSSTKKSIYLYFSHPYKVGQIRGVLRSSDFKGTFSPEILGQFTNMEIVIDGISITETSKNPHLVKINNIGQISAKK